MKNWNECTQNALLKYSFDNSLSWEEKNKIFKEQLYEPLRIMAQYKAKDFSSSINMSPEEFANDIISHTVSKFSEFTYIPNDSSYGSNWIFAVMKQYCLNKRRKEIKFFDRNLPDTFVKTENDDELLLKSDLVSYNKWTEDLIAANNALKDKEFLLLYFNHLKTSVKLNRVSTEIKIKVLDKIIELINNGTTNDRYQYVQTLAQEIGEGKTYVSSLFKYLRTFAYQDYAYYLDNGKINSKLPIGIKPFQRDGTKKLQV